MSDNPSTIVSTPAADGTARRQRHYCRMAEVPLRTFSELVAPGRASLIQSLSDKWVSGTTLRYYFFTDSHGPNEWVGPESERAMVRAGFDAWSKLGIGIRFEEAQSPDEAEVRIGFLQGDGAWSYVGRYVLRIGRRERTMNFGWRLAPGDFDTAIHEIGHTLGFHHEHQNPFAGIVWDEPAVYKELAGPPNHWPKETTYHNIIKKLDPSSVQGTNWDPNSIMHYPFEAGLIVEPAPYRTGLQPAGGLSQSDRSYALKLYPPVANQIQRLTPFKSEAFHLNAGEQASFEIVPDSTRYYEIRTFGTSDVVMVLFETRDGMDHYVTADDDSGEDRNAYLRLKLVKGSRYVLRVRQYYADRPGDTAVMIW